MDILRRNTDYALRLMVNLARKDLHEPVSTRELANEEDVSYQLACKLMQKLQVAGLVESCMGPKGGFRLSRQPKSMSLLDVVEAIQGRISLNRCLLGDKSCPRRMGCSMRAGLDKLQQHMKEYFNNITIEQLTEMRPRSRRMPKKGTRRKR